MNIWSIHLPVVMVEVVEFVYTHSSVIEMQTGLQPVTMSLRQLVLVNMETKIVRNESYWSFDVGYYEPES
jgi:hypothetical protein